MHPLIRERDEGGETEKPMREKHQWVASCTHLDWGLNPKPRHVC